MVSVLKKREQICLALTVTTTARKMSEEKLPYPKSVFFIVGNEFCERFCYYGLRGILVLYLSDKLKFDEADSKITYHTFSMLVYFFPLIGGIISDSWLGKFNTILYFSIIYACGCVLLSLGAADPLKLPQKEITILALLLIASGTGGIKPCISSFGGDQFILPQQEARVASFFSLFYFAINTGSLLALSLTPIMRNDIHCLGSNSCYPLAFAVPSIMMILAIIIIAAGKPFYRISEKKSNIVVNVVNCITEIKSSDDNSRSASAKIVSNRVSVVYLVILCSFLVFTAVFVLLKLLTNLAIYKEKMTNKRVVCGQMGKPGLFIFSQYAIVHRSVANPGNHWLDRSSAKHGAQLVHDIKILLKVLVLFIPLPVFWALYDQQGSGWTFQAVRMNGECGFYTILPDQMQVTNPIFILAFIPLFTYIVYPALAKCHLLRKPLQRMCCGGFLAAVSFAISACLAMALERTYPVLPSKGEAQVRIYDPTNCRYSFSTTDNVISGAQISGYHLVSSIKIPNGARTVHFTFMADSNTTDCKPREMQININEKTAYGIYISDTTEGFFIDNIQKSDNGYPLVRTLTSNSSLGITYTHVEKGESVSISSGETSLRAISNVGKYIADSVNQQVEFKLGGTYTVIINQELKTIRTIVVTKPNTIHMLWLLPQYIVLTVGELMFSITGLEFAYSEAPISMKAVLQSCWLLTTAIGNLLVVFIEALKIFELQSLNFFVYTGIMASDMVLFMFLALAYKHPDIPDVDGAQ